MVALDFGDELTFSPHPTGISLECDHPTLPVDDTNLAVRAAKCLAKMFDVKTGVHITLRKRTPLAAGLGGGSSNGAIVLRGLNEFWKLNAPESKLHEIAASLGTD